MKTNKNIYLILLMFAVLLPAAYSFGVTTPYWSTNPLVMSPGQTIEFSLLLQNMVGSENIRAVAKVTYGTEYAEITDKSNEYDVPLGTKDTKINLKVKIPEITQDGNYSIGIQVDTIPEGESRMVQFGTGVQQNIPLQVRNGISQPKPIDLTQNIPIEQSVNKTKGKSYLGLIIVLVIIVLLLGLLWYRKRKKSYES